MLQYQRNLLRHLSELANLDTVYVKLVKRMGGFSHCIQPNLCKRSNDENNILTLIYNLEIKIVKADTVY